MGTIQAFRKISQDLCRIRSRLFHRTHVAEFTKNLDLIGKSGKSISRKAAKQSREGAKGNPCSSLRLSLWLCAFARDAFLSLHALDDHRDALTATDTRGSQS